MPSRRSVLLGAGGLFAATAGCATLDGGDGTPTATPIGTPDDGRDGDRTAADVAVEDVVVRKAVRYESLMGSGGVLAASDEQYVVGVVSAEASLSPSDFAFEAADESWAPGLPDTAGAVNGSVAGREGRPLDYGASEPARGAILAFAVQSPLSAPDPAIRYTGTEPETWPLDDAARERLAAPEPAFELESLDVPDEIRQGERLEVTMDVTNGSGTDGRFLAAVYWPTDAIADDDESHVVEQDIAAGESETISPSIDTRYSRTEDGPVPLRVRGHVSAEREVLVSGTSGFG